MRGASICPSANRVALLQQATGEQPQQSLLWKNVLGAHGIGDIASLALRDKFGFWGFLDLWRSGSSARFGPADATALAAIVEPVTAALRRSQAVAFAGGPRRSERAGPVVLLLSDDLEVLGQTPSTHEFLQVLVPPEAGHAPIPASAYHVAAQLLAADAGIDQHPARARVHLGESLWLTMRAAFIDDGSAESPRRIAVTIEESSPTERIDLFVRAYGLSARESELLGNLVRGIDTKAVARLMFLSEHTVQDHLKSIFMKTGTSNRKALLSRALGT